MQYWTKYSLIKWLEELATLNKFRLSPFLATLQDSRLGGLNVKCELRKSWFGRNIRGRKAGDSPREREQRTLSEKIKAKEKAVCLGKQVCPLFIQNYYYFLLFLQNWSKCILSRSVVGWQKRQKWPVGGETMGHIPKQQEPLVGHAVWQCYPLTLLGGDIKPCSWKPSPNAYLL